VPVRISSIHEVQNFLQQKHAALVEADAVARSAQATSPKTRR